MKRQTDFLLTTLFFSSLLLFTGCKKVDPPSVATDAVSDVTVTSAKAGGKILDDGGAEVTARGVVWSKETSPTTSDNMTSDGTGTGEFTSQINGLSEGTTYYLRAYATNSEGTAYGNETTFATAETTTPSLTTVEVTGVTLTSATTGGNITSDGLAEVTARGVCWGTSPNPTIDGNKTTDGKGTGIFTSNITGLTEGTVYYIRAYATNSKGTAYGNEITFSTTSKSTPSLTTLEATEITFTSAKTGGNVTSDGLSEVTARGVCWGISANPTIAGNKTTNGSGLGTFTSNITGLSEGITYHVRAYATNSKGTAYGNEVTFTTLAMTIPSVTTLAATEISFTSAKTGGNVTSDGLSTVTARGVCWSTTPGPTIAGNKTTNGTGVGTFASTLTGLTDGTTYYVRAYATNSKGTAYGNEITFSTTAATSATLTTAALTALTLTGVTSGGNITNDGGAAVTARGVVYGTTPGPTVTGTKTTNGSGTGTYVSNVTGLTPGTVYYLRAYATNSKGTVYGNELTFVTPIADVDGNVYKTVVIGNQIWMAENLKTTRFNNNAAIPNVTDSLQWMTLTTPAYCWYRNRESNKQYGALYTWYTISGGNLCPQGWHVPTNAEYQTMEVAIGVPADSVNNWGWRGNGAGTKLKDATAWGAGNGTNTTGFTALPSGYRAWANSEFRGLGIISYLWTASDDAVNGHPDVGWYRRLDATSPWIYKATTGKTGGKSVRCMKNQ